MSRARFGFSWTLGQQAHGSGVGKCLVFVDAQRNRCWKMPQRISSPGQRREKKMLKGLSDNSPSSFLSPIPVMAPAKPARPCQHGSLLYFPGFFPSTPWLAMWLNDTFAYPRTCLHGSKSDLHRLLQLWPASHYSDNTLFQTFTF